MSTPRWTSRIAGPTQALTLELLDQARARMAAAEIAGNTEIREVVTREEYERRMTALPDDARRFMP